MNAIANWLAMGGYAAFVWPAYTIAAGALAALSAQSYRRYRRSEAELVGLTRDPGE